MTTTADSPSSVTDTEPDPLISSIREKLQQSPQPLKLAEVVKGLPRPKKVKAADFQNQVLQALDAEFQMGRVFRYPSGAKGTERFWVRDEKQALRDAVMKAAAEPKSIATLKKEIGKSSKGTDANFIEEVIRGLIADDRLFEHASKRAPLFAAHAPPPPQPKLYQPKFRKKLDTLAKSAAKLISETDSTPDELFAALQEVLTSSTSTQSASTQDVASAGGTELEQLILKAVANAGPGSVLSLADLRRELPPEFQGPVFDAAILRLADEERVRVYQDADPLQFTPEERAELVSDHLGHLYTSIAKRG